MEIIFPEIADNAPPDEVHAWYCEVDRRLNDTLSFSSDTASKTNKSKRTTERKVPMKRIT